MRPSIAVDQSRLLDIGGDKPLPYLALPPTSNPGLGRRGVRLLLNFSQLVRTQMGAILKLSREHSVRVLIPMVTLEDDIRRMREVFNSMSAERKITNPPEFGAMVETPAAALAIPSLLKHVDFFCVGTNDLTQYTLAAARDDASVNDYYLDSHESIMRLLSIILTRGRRATRDAVRGVGWPRSIRATPTETGISRAERCANRHSHDEGANTQQEPTGPAA